ncbi:MAG: hypothetical protein ABUL49_00120 [bacterium]
MRLHNLARPALGVLLLSALSIVALARADDTYALRSKVKVGDVVNSKYTANLDFGMAKVKVTAGTKATIAEVKGDGSFVVSGQQRGLKVYQDDKLVQEQEEGTVGKTTFAADGQALEFDAGALEGQPESLSVSMARLTSFIAPANPVKLNEEWVINYKADKDKDVLAGVAKFKIVAIEKLGDADVAVVESSFKELGDDDPLTSDGKHWINIATGEDMKSVLNIKNLPTPMGVKAKSGTIESEVVKS